MNEFDDDEAVQPGGPKPFIDRRAQATRVGLVVPDVRGQIYQHSLEARQSEFEGLAAAIERLMSDAVLRQQLAAAGQAFARATYSKDRLLRDMIQLYREFETMPASSRPTG